MSRDRKQLGTERLFVDVYSAGNQRRYASAEFPNDRYIGQLRLDLLLARTLVVPDTYILDGRFFTHTTPKELSLQIGRGLHSRTLPLEVRTRGNGPLGRRFATSLRTFLAHTTDDLLNAFQFNAVAIDTDRSDLARELGVTPKTDLDRCLEGADDIEVPARLARFLSERASVSAHDDIERLAHGWRHWIEAERTGGLTTTPWGPTFDIATVLLDLRPLPPTTLRTPLGGIIYDGVLRLLRSGSRHRSHLDALMERARHAGREASGAEAIDLETINRWYSAGRHVAIAQQHGATAVASSFHPDQPATSNVEHAAQNVANEGAGVDLVAPDEFIPILTTMSGEQFGLFSFNHRSQLENIWAGGGPDEVRRVIDSLLRTTEPVDRRSIFKEIAVTAGALGATTSVFTMLTKELVVLAAGVSGSAAAIAAAGAELIPRAQTWKKRRDVVSRAIEFLAKRSSSLPEKDQRT